MHLLRQLLARRADRPHAEVFEVARILVEHHAHELLERLVVIILGEDDVEGAARELADVLVLLVDAQVDLRLDRLALLLAHVASDDGRAHGRRQVAEANDVGQRLVRLALLRTVFSLEGGGLEAPGSGSRHRYESCVCA